MRHLMMLALMITCELGSAATLARMSEYGDDGRGIPPRFVSSRIVELSTSRNGLDGQPLVVIKGEDSAPCLCRVRSLDEATNLFTAIATTPNVIVSCSPISNGDDLNAFAQMGRAICTLKTKLN